MPDKLRAAVEQLSRALAKGAPPDAELATALQRLEEAAAELDREREWIARNQRDFDQRLLTIEHGMWFRGLRALGSAAGTVVRFASALAGRRAGPDPDAQYRLWLAAEQVTIPSAEEQRAAIARFARRPAISLLLDAQDARPELLRRAVESVLAQPYDCWELFISIPEAQAAAAKVPEDPRVRIGSGASSRSELVAVIGAHDMLAPHALFEIARRAQDGVPGLLYSDEDHLDDAGRRCQPVFKPGWSPELLAGRMYLGRLLVFSRAAFESAGGFTQELDTALRLAENGVRAEHIAKVLYHRCGIASPGTAYVLRRRPAEQPLVSIIVCSRNARLVRRVARAVEQHTAYSPWELVIAEHRYGDARVSAAIDSLSLPATRVPYDQPFNFSRMNNLAVRSARGEVLVFLNDDVEPLAPDWLERLVAQAVRPEIGAVGARLLYPSGAIQHAGIAVGIMDGAGHPGRSTQGSPFWPWLETTREVSAVTGACFAVRRAVFDELGGFDPEFASNYNDVDFCLRAGRAGYRVIYEAGAVLRHDECQTRRPLVRYDERWALFQRWGDVLLSGDPFYNPNLTRDREDASLRLETPR